MLRLSAAGLAAELAIPLTTVTPGVPVVPTAVVILLFLGCFPIHFRTVAVLITRTGGRIRPDALRDLVDPVPVAARVGFLAFFVAAWVITAASFAHLGGQPTASHGRYFLNDHGSLLPVTHQAYLHAQIVQKRIFTLIPSVFYALGVLVNWPPRSSDEPVPASAGSPPLPS